MSGSYNDYTFLIIWVWEAHDEDSWSLSSLDLFMFYYVHTEESWWGFLS